MIRKAINHLLDILFPRLCVVCGDALVQGEQHICLHCIDLMPRTRYHLQTDNPLEQLFFGKVTIERVTSLFYFAHHPGYRQLIHHIKYRDGKACARYMGQLAAREVVEGGLFTDIDAIIPVPLHPRRRAQRGFNQSEEIAQGISLQTGIPVWSDLLIRTKHNPTQTRKQREERWDNVKSIFHLSQPTKAVGRHLLLVDDVLTSGSTLEACARELLNAEGLRISILTLATA